jgi:hypothetical protein
VEEIIQQVLKGIVVLKRNEMNKKEEKITK